MRSDLCETWYNVHGGIKEAPKKIWDQYVHARACNVRKHACMFLYLVIVLKGAEIGGDEEKEIWSRGSNVPILTTIFKPLRVCAPARRL